MVEVYVILIIRGFKKIDDVPERLQQEVKSALILLGYTELAERA
ncbi:CD1375 family protein [Thermoactinomyces sp. DSM 45892]